MSLILKAIGTIYADKRTAIDYLNEFKQARTSVVGVYNTLSGVQKNAALTRLTNWNAGTATANENALYAAVALLYAVVGYLIADRLNRR